MLTPEAVDAQRHQRIRDHVKKMTVFKPRNSMQNVNKRCKCVVVVDEETGVLKSTSKCQHHIDALKKELGDEEAHYRRFPAFEGEGNYWAEFEKILDPIYPAHAGSGLALEIGTGTSPYAARLIERGYKYTGIDPSPFVNEWMMNKFGRGQGPNNIVMHQTNWDDFKIEGTLVEAYDIVLAAHSVEHMKHGPNGIKKMAQAVKPGGLVYIIVPNDDDLCNPDHLWFFTEATLRKSVDDAGLMVQRLGSQRIVKHEMFMYCKAAKL